MGLEAEVQKAIMAYLEMKGHLAFRINTGAFGFSYKGRKRFMRTAPKGFPDIIGVEKGTGRAFAIEVKRPAVVIEGKKKHKSYPSKEQKEMLARFSSVGALALVAYSVDDVIDAGL